MDNYMKLTLLAVSENEGFARSAVSAFALCLNPSLSELSDIKTAVSEAVTNCIVHAYQQSKTDNYIVIECKVNALSSELHIEITDTGCGIVDLEQALMPFYTTLPYEERSGMGFTIMQTFMDDFQIESKTGAGTKITMKKRIGFDENQETKQRLNA